MLYTSYINSIPLLLVSSLHLQIFVPCFLSSNFSDALYQDASDASNSAPLEELERRYHTVAIRINKDDLDSELKRLDQIILHFKEKIINDRLSAYQTELDHLKSIEKKISEKKCFITMPIER